MAAAGAATGDWKLGVTGSTQMVHSRLGSEFEYRPFGKPDITWGMTLGTTTFVDRLFAVGSQYLSRETAKCILNPQLEQLAYEAALDPISSWSWLLFPDDIKVTPEPPSPSRKDTPTVATRCLRWVTHWIPWG